MKRSLKRLISIICVAFVITASLESPFQGMSAVSAAAKKTTLKKSKVTIKVGSSYTIAFKNKNKKAKYTFSSSKKNVASVNKKGKVTAKKKGTANITVKQTLKKKTTKIGKLKVTVQAKKKTVTTAPSTAPPTLTPSSVPPTTPPTESPTTQPTVTPSNTPTATPAATPTTTPKPANIIKNGNFEEDTEYWSINFGGSMEVVEDPSVGKCLKLTGRGNIYAQPIQELGPLETGDKYFISVDVLFEEGSPNGTEEFTIVLKLGPEDSDEQRLITQTVNNGEWTTVSGTVTIDPGYEEVNIMFRNMEPYSEDVRDFSIANVYMGKVN